MSVQLQKATQENYQRAVMVIFPLAPDQTIAQMWSNGARGGRPPVIPMHKMPMAIPLVQPIHPVIDN